MKIESSAPIELLSPCGNYESLMAAIQGGCSSVYFGVEQLNMRARSTINFTLEDLAGINKIAKANGIKTYITLNTILYDHDMVLMKTIVDHAKQNGIDAIIAADMAVINYVLDAGVPLHLSTQTNITNIESVAFYSRFADVMVLARELTLSQVKKIVHEIHRRNIKGPSGELVKVEIFVHGALCMAISGKCYMSLHSHFASANRGACIQNCRRSYVVVDKEEGTAFEIDNEYIMSAKDLCTIGFLDKIIDSGVSVLKIEGRGRSEDYVFKTTKCYREAIHAMQNETYSLEKIQVWRKELETVFNRGFWGGYYLGRKMGEWNDEYGSKATRKKVYIGKGVKYFERAGVGEFKIEAHFIQIGDEIMVSGPTTGVVFDSVKEIRKNNSQTNNAVKGDVISIPVSNKIRPSDRLFKIVNA